MKAITSSSLIVIISILLSLVSSSVSFTYSTSKIVRHSQQLNMNDHPFCDLPGDPSLILTTNVDLGDNKSSILKELSSLVATTTGKPESYVAISVTDKASMVFGGSDAPLALGCMYSLGAINKENNGKIQSGVTDVLEKYGVKEDRIYINFFDMARENVGWSRRTFAG